MNRSPWWYRYRAVAFGAIYFFGFLLGPIVAQLANLDPAPTFLQLGALVGPHGYRYVTIFALLLVIVCWALRFWGTAYLRPATVWNPGALDDRLLVDGPFRFVRNPLYLGNVLLALGGALFAAPLGSAIVFVGNLVLILGLVRVEERLLRARYGAAFEAYAAAVPALWPRATPWITTNTPVVAPAYGPALRSELFSAAFAVAVLIATIRFW